MFKKVLKYDMRSIYNIWWIIAATVLGVSVFGAFALRFTIANINDPDGSFLAVFSMLAAILSIVAVISSIAVTSLLTHYRFYKNFYTDEGYLTFTLPVSRKVLLLSKTVNAMIWHALHAALFVISMLIFFLIAPPAAGGPIINTVVFREFGLLIAELWSEIGGWTILYVFELILILCFSGVFSIVLIEFCITIGAIIAKKQKLLAAIGIYYLVNMALSLVSQLALTLGLGFGLEGLEKIMDSVSKNAGCAIIAFILILVCAIIAALAFTAYYIMQRKIERNLNLA